MKYFFDVHCFLTESHWLMINDLAIYDLNFRMQMITRTLGVRRRLLLLLRWYRQPFRPSVRCYTLRVSTNFRREVTCLLDYQYNQFKPPINNNEVKKLLVIFSFNRFQNSQIQKLSKLAIVFLTLLKNTCLILLQKFICNIKM